MLRATAPAAFPIAAALGLASAGLGLLGAREQRRAADRANQPQPFESHTITAPWAPAIPSLEDALGIAQEIFQQRRAYPAPPVFAPGGGNRGNLRAIADEVQRRALGSTFVPEAQELALGIARAPNPLLQAAFDRISSYQSPMLGRLFERGMTPGGLVPNAALEGFLTNLLGGQTQLGQVGPPPSPVLPLIAQLAETHFADRVLPHGPHLEGR